MLGQMIGGYRVVRLLGEGPNGKVWLAEHPELETVVAIKTLPPDLVQTTERDRFERGAKAAARLTHTGIAGITHANFGADPPFIISEYVDGDTINDLLARGPLDLDVALDIVIQAARALDYAHGEGVIHRDISGGNVMVTHDGRVKLVDFGMAIEHDSPRFTTVDSDKTTWPYASPETLRRAPVTPARDTYGISVVLYQLLAGRLPFVSETMEALFYQIMNEDPDPPSFHRAELPAVLDRIVLRGLDKNPRLRISAKQLAEELHALRTTETLALAQRRAEQKPPRLQAPPAVSRLVRRVATLPPSRVRKLAGMAALSVMSIAAVMAGAYAFLPLGPVAPRVASIAVVPLYNESPLQGFEFFGHGLGSTLTQRLESLEGLLVQPYRRSLWGDAQELCEQLNVEGVIEGGFSVNGGRVDVHVDLVTKDGKRKPLAVIHADGYNRAVADLVAAVSHRLKSRLTASEEARVTAAPASGNEPLEALMRGQEAHQKGDRDAALTWYERALSLDPGLAGAYVGSGSIYYDRYFRSKAGAVSLDVAEGQFRQALAIDPDDGGALRGMILIHYERSERDSGLAIGHRAARRLTNRLEALVVPAWAYCLLGMPDLALPLLEKAAQLDPESDEVMWLRVVANAWAKRPRETIATGEAYLSRFSEDPEIYLWVGTAWTELGESDRATHLFRRAIDLFGDDTQLYVSLYAGLHLYENSNEVEARKVWADAISVAEKRKLVAADNLRLRSTLFGLYAAMNQTAEMDSEATFIAATLTERNIGVDPSGILIGMLHGPPERQNLVVQILERVGVRGALASAYESGLPPGTRREVQKRKAAMRIDPRMREILEKAKTEEDRLRSKYGPPST
jgi:serine/threonine-protein kinase